MKIYKVMKGALSAFVALSVAAATVPCKVLADDAMSTLAGNTGLSLIELTDAENI